MKALFALAAAALCASPALANPPASGAWRVGADSYHIYYADLDVKTPAGRAELLARTEKAADRLCDGLVRRDREACVFSTVAGSANPDIQRALADGRPSRAVERDGGRRRAPTGGGLPAAVDARPAML
jgi:UrcA family protein